MTWDTAEIKSKRSKLLIYMLQSKIFPLGHKISLCRTSLYMSVSKFASWNSGKNAQTLLKHRSQCQSGPLVCVAICLIYYFIYWETWCSFNKDFHLEPKEFEACHWTFVPHALIKSKMAELKGWLQATSIQRRKQRQGYSLPSGVTQYVEISILLFPL